MGTGWKEWIREQLNQTQGSDEAKLLTVFNAFLDELQDEGWDGKGLLARIKAEIAEELEAVKK